MNSNKINSAAIIFGMALFFSTSSFGQAQNRQERKKPPTFEELIEQMDANEDGKLSKNEIKGRLKKDFSKVDANEDGFITEKEFEKAPRPERGPKK